MTKKWFTSKTLYANALLISVGIQQNLQLLDISISPAALGWTLFAFGVVNVILRLVTDSGIEK